MIAVVCQNPLPRFKFGLAFALIYLLHLGLVTYALPLNDLLGGRPFAPPDYQTHYGQTTTLTRVVDTFGKFWAYDPSMLAGHPVGLIFDVDNKLHFLFSYGLFKCGVPLPTAFNLFTLLSCLLAPLSLWLTARLLRLSSRAQLMALAFGVLLWHFDSGARVWTGGMISFATVSHGSLVVWALYYRMLHDRVWWPWPALLVLLPLNLLVHVWSFSILAVPLIALYLRLWRHHRPAQHLQVWGLALFSLAINSYWLYPALKHIYLLSPSGVVGQANPLHLLADWLELLVNPITTGFSFPHTFFRFAAICGAVLTLWRWHRQLDPRRFYATLTLSWLFGMGYCAALFPVLRETEPYRFVMPGFLLAGILASAWYEEVFSRQTLSQLSKPARIIIAVLILLLIPRIAAQVVYFIPELRPDTKLPPIVVNQAKAAPTATIPAQAPDPAYLPSTWRLRGVDTLTLELASYVRDQIKEPGRVLVQHWAIAECLRWATGKPIIGGFPDRRLIHEDANLFRRPTDPRFWKKAFSEYLKRYNIRYVIFSEFVPVLESRRDAMTPHKMIGPHRIYRTNHQATYVARGAGDVRAALNRLEVSHARPAPDTQTLLLRFHYMKTLRCRPHCSLRRTPIADDRAGFITVVGQPRLPATIVIENHY